MLQIWAPKAKQIQSISSAMYNTIDGMKQLLKLESQFEIDKDGKEKFNDANLDAATRVFDKDGKGKILYRFPGRIQKADARCIKSERSGYCKKSGSAKRSCKGTG